MKTVKFLTLGCKVNQYETEELRERFLQAGFREPGAGEKAGTYVINTCTVTAAADRKSRYLIQRSLRQNPLAEVIVTGCYAERDARELSTIKGVSRVVRNRDKARIAALLGLRGSRGGGISAFPGRTRAFLKVQDGCNNRCAYCKVSLVRGPSKSKAFEQAVAEARRIAAGGFKEIVLCGICLGSYGMDLSPRRELSDLLKEIEAIDGLQRLRLSSIEAKDVSPGLVAALSAGGKLCRHLHIPMQSGDDGILRRMRRAYRSKDYLRLADDLKQAVPHIAITTDIIVGFPGESAAAFENTLKLVRRVMPAKVHIFPYSRREGTEAASFRDEEIPRDVVRERVRSLEALSQECSIAYRRRFLGEVPLVLVEGRAKDDRHCWEGYTDTYIKVRFKEGKELRNRLVPVRLMRLQADHVLGISVDA